MNQLWLFVTFSSSFHRLITIGYSSSLFLSVTAPHFPSGAPPLPNSCVGKTIPGDELPCLKGPDPSIYSLDLEELESKAWYPCHYYSTYNAVYYENVLLSLLIKKTDWLS